VVEKSYFDTIDDALAEKAHLSNYLLPHNEVVFIDDISELLHGELQELFTSYNLLKVLNDVVVGLGVQFEVEADISELPDADAVFWAQYPLEEVTAGLYDIHSIELISS